MTAEQRTARLREINEQQIKLLGEENKLLSAERFDIQQACLQWVGRAFVGYYATYLVTSVPPIRYAVRGYDFNQYQYPCITIPNKASEPPVFDDTFCITEDTIQKMKEIPFVEFQSLLHERLDYILKRAATAKMRQTGKEIFAMGDREICEK